MEEVEFSKKHGYRFCFYIIYMIISFIPISWLKNYETESQKYWNVIYFIQMSTAVILPFFIEGWYVRKYDRTYLDRLGTVRSFYLAPVLGMLLTLTVPMSYFFYCAAQPDPLFKHENLAWSLTVIFSFFIDIGIFCYLGYEAH